MKKIFIALLALTTITASASAQEKKEFKGDHQRKGHHQKDMLAKQLGFSDDQKKQAKLYNDDFRKKMQDLNKNENITVKEQRDRKNALLKEKKAKMDGLLTPDQKNKLAQLKIDQQKKHEERFAKHLDKMKTDLKLSETQVAQLKAQREANHAKLKAIKDNEKLSREEKKSQMMAIRTATKEQNKKIFTADQLKQMEDKHKKRNERPAK